MIKRIIMADDDFDDRQLFQMVIAESGLDVILTIAKDGEELMQELSRLKSYLYLPEIIFLDINMPRKDGFECLEEIRKDEILKDKTIVMLSTSNNPEDVNKCYELGASAFITKPNSFDKLEQAVGAIVAAKWPYTFKKPDRERFVMNV